MQIVIDIPDKVYGVIKYFESALDSNYKKDDDVKTVLIKALLNGTPLPKGHGRLIDADALIKQLEAMANDEWNKHVGASKGLEDAIDIVDDAPTIIEAESEV